MKNRGIAEEILLWNWNQLHSVSSTASSSSSAFDFARTRAPFRLVSHRLRLLNAIKFAYFFGNKRRRSCSVCSFLFGSRACAGLRISSLFFSPSLFVSQTLWKFVCDCTSAFLVHVFACRSSILLCLRSNFTWQKMSFVREHRTPTSNSQRHTIHTKQLYEWSTRHTVCTWANKHTPHSNANLSAFDSR